MNSITKRVPAILTQSSSVVNSLSRDCGQLQQCRGIRVKVKDGNLEGALGMMQRVMQNSGMDRIIRQTQTRHLKNSEKRVLAQKNLQHKIRSQDLCRKLQIILTKKARGL